MSKCRHLLFEKFPGSKTKMVRRDLRQGMSNKPRVKFDKLVEVRCAGCGKHKWLEATSYELQLPAVRKPKKEVVTV